MMILKNIIIRKLSCPIICLSLSIVGCYFIFSGLKIAQNIEYKNYLEPEVVRDDIMFKIDDYVRKYKEGYWFTWIVVDEDKYYFVDVKGYNPNSHKDDKVFSVKYSMLNPYYLEKHILDGKSKKWLDSLDTGVVGYYSTIEDLKGFKSVYESINASNLDINSFGLSVTKNIDKKTIYVFVISETLGLDQKAKHDIVDDLQELSIYAKHKL